MADKEKLSAFIDGELVDKALIQELEQDQDSLDTWQSYHLIGDVMRGDAAAKPEWNIAASVALALENEPIHRKVDSSNNNVISIDRVTKESQPKPYQAKQMLPNWLTQLGQVSIAACVSLVVILGVQQYGDDSASSSTEQLPVLQTVPFSGSAEPVSLTRESVERTPSEVNIQEQRKRVQAMLMDHELQLRINKDTHKKEASLTSGIE
ncbi:sigma-E factor negative regulatory protein [Vibrio sagamiensis]|uniref:Anti-sigma-E factor RseA n=1 Tax=Vibrio sagamiensis NBRC 104589 TaxID=1219064 RepID=A0A511QGY7_9VIBR|nr:sigma-E factor negative regulatory protein [Vibrio sagamiensis]GEM76457.1 anti-sigma-E factor RseA [Vibrio sagamiensis NBRC 104589]